MSPEFSHALVTGGAGFIGSHLTRRLLQEGLRVSVLDDLSMGSRDNLPGDVRFIEGDICDPAVVQAAVADVDIVFHNAARVSIRASIEQFVEDAQTNVFGTLVLLRELVRSRVRRLVMASSMAVYADAERPEPINEDYLLKPLSPYGTGKLAAETYALQIGKAHGLEVLPLRYFNTYGPGQAYTAYVGVVTIFATKLLRGERPIIFGDGQQVRDFVSVHDIVQGNICAMHSLAHGQPFNIGSGRGMSVNEIAELLIAKIAPKLSAVYADPQAGETRNSIADISRARQLLGYHPTGIFSDSLDAIIQAIASKLSK